MSGLNLNNLGGSGNSAADRDQSNQGEEGKQRTISQQGNGASLRNDPPATISGTSPSLLVDPAVGEPVTDTPTAKLNEAIASQAAANSGVIAEENEGTMYSSHPIANYQIGRFKFEKGLIRLDAKDAAQFEGLLESLPVTERSRIQKLDVAGAERIVKERLEEQRRAGATTQFDSSVGERADPSFPRVGTGRLGDEAETFANVAQTDMNRPVHSDDAEPLSSVDASRGQEADMQESGSQ